MFLFYHYIFTTKDTKITKNNFVSFVSFASFVVKLLHSVILYQFAFKDRSFQTVKRFFKSFKPLEKRFYGEHSFWQRIGIIYFL